MIDENERTQPVPEGDQAVIELIEAQTRWGERSTAEHRAFEAQLEARLDRSRPAWGVPALASAAIAAGLAVLLVGLPVPTPDPEVGRSFLVTAYYTGSEEVDSEFASQDGNPDYLPADLRSWSDALADAEAEAGSST